MDRIKIKGFWKQTPSLITISNITKMFEANIGILRCDNELKIFVDYSDNKDSFVVFPFENPPNVRDNWLWNSIDEKSWCYLNSIMCGV